MTDQQRELAIGLLLEARDLLKYLRELPRYEYDDEKALDWMSRAADLIDEVEHD